MLYGRLAASPAFRQGIDQVLARAQTQRIALLCSEEDPSRCHRHLLIGRVLRERGVPVSHLRRDGRVETEEELAAQESNSGPQPTLFKGGREETAMEIYTIGFTKKSAAQFFGALSNSGITQLLDVRLNNISQLARLHQARRSRILPP